MALPTISTADFIADIRLSQNRFRTTELERYITFYYPGIVADLIGEAALQEVEDASPLPAKYTDLFSGSGTYYNVEEEEDRKKPQLVELVKRILYAVWVRDNSINTTSGDAVNKSENADMLDRNQIAANARQVYNWAVRRFNDRVIPFLENYTDYESSITAVNDLGGGVMEILTPDTIYLANGDTVQIGGDDYTISSLVDNTSFRVTASFVSTPTVYTYSPFEILNYTTQDPILF